MKYMKRYAITVLVALLAATAVDAQRSYITTDGEMIFSLADVTRGGVPLDSDLRWTVWYHSGTYHNHDITRGLGLFYGMAIRNVGFITHDEVLGGTNYSTIKRRSYSLGLPVGIKLGDLKRNMFLFGGAEYEWLFHYKEKRFLDGERIYRGRDWFSHQTNRFIPSLYAGINFPSQTAITFKFYLEDFMNSSYREPVSGIMPYTGMKTQVFYISLSKRFKYKRVRDIFTPTPLTVYHY
jgi:hypothetical protein